MLVFLFVCFKRKNNVGLRGVYAYATYALLNRLYIFFPVEFDSLCVLLLNEYLKYGSVERTR